MSLIKAKNLHLEYPGLAAPAVNDVSFEMSRGEIFALLGPSGSGKTSTLRILGGFERPESGTVEIAGRVVESATDFVPPEKRNVGFVFQEFALFPHLTVMENVCFGLGKLSKADKERRAMDILERAQLEKFANRYPRQLSGGQQQRVALARAMAPRPQVVMLDEPFGSLDRSLRDDAQRKIHAVLRDNDMSAILVTHDQSEALSFADRIAVMRDGVIDQVGTPSDLYSNPETVFVAEFIGGANVIAGMASGRNAETPIGSIPINRASDGAVNIALRPEHLEIVAPDNGRPSGAVIERMYYGHDLTLQVSIGGISVTVWDDYRCTYAVGDTVSIAAREDGVVVE